jgi:DNA primase
VPGEVENPSIAGDKYLNYMLKDGATEASRHAYRDEAGNLKGYVFRIEKADGSKITPPLAWCENEKGVEAWKWLGFEKENKTPYGIEKLAQNPHKPILVVEGEKTADAAQKLLPEHNVLTWSGGAGNVGKTNWECLAGREVVVWPDNDSGGLKAADTLQKIVSSVNTEKGLDGSVSLVSLPSTLPEKWDLADKLPEGWTFDTVKEIIKEATPQKSIEIESLSQDMENSITQTDILESQKSYTAEERETLAYLKENINPEKHSWLRENLSQHLLDLAVENPLNALKEWQDLSSDYSFKPSLPVEPLTKEQQESYNIQAADVLTYLKDEINIEKHSWLRENLCQHLLELAKDKPFDALKEWQELANDYSFKPSLPIEPLTKEQQEAHKLQAADVLTYLKDEISTEKHSWLREEYSKNLLKAAEADPVKTLTRWQDVSGDFSFKPLMPEAIMSKEQLEFKETIMTYLKEEVRPEKHTIADEEYSDKLFKMMDRDPLKSLQEWQKDSFDYSFNPFKEQLNDREIRVQEYIIEKILDEDRPFSKQRYADVTANLLDKPLEAYQTLQLYTSDNTFDPTTGIPKIEMEAQELVSKIKDFTNDDHIKGLEERLNASPESVINECNSLILRHEKDTQLESVANKFVTLTEQLDKMAWHDPAHDETSHEIESLVEKNIKNREFIRMVEVSKSSVAIEKLHSEIEERQQQHTMSRGM